MMDLIRSIGERLKDSGSVLWRCIYSTGLTLAGLAGATLVPQGVELLRLTSQPGWNFPLFLVSVAAWSLSAWYGARLTLGRIFEAGARVDRANGPYIACLRKWWPRLLGVLPGLVMTVQFWRLDEAALAAAFGLATLLLAAFMVRRRRWFAARFAGPDAPLRFWQLQRETVRTVVAAIALSFALLLLVWWRPVEATRYLTAPVLLCFALASWILFGDLVLTYFFKQARLPSMAALPLLLFVVSSLTNDNHAVALLADRTAAPARPAVAARFEAWLEARLASGELREGETFPVFLVAAEGGGIRAAYWGGNVLAKLQDDSGERFGRHLFALSGVSGGSLASTVFTALMADAGSGALQQAACAQQARGTRYQDCTRKVLRRDFLSPVLAYLLYPDMLQRFVPLALPSCDRARAMEAGLRAGWTEAIGTRRFDERFDRLWRDAPAASLPALLLNATLVARGNRLIASDVAIDASFPDAYDAFDPLLELGRMSLATAVHNSARFAYVSPAGTVSACRGSGGLRQCAIDDRPLPWGRVIDGAYFEDSGVETLRDLLFAMRPVLAKWKQQKGERFRIEPVVIVISNAPGAHAPSGRADPQRAGSDPDFLSELLAPPMGLFNTRIARATFAVYANSRDMGAIEPGDTVRFYWFGLSADDTPLGWALADRTFKGMDRLLDAPPRAELPFAKVIGSLPRR